MISMFVGTIALVHRGALDPACRSLRVFGSPCAVELKALIPADAKAAAYALATARAELVNLEKSFTAGRAGEGERTFRYVPLKTSPATQPRVALWKEGAD